MPDVDEPLALDYFSAGVPTGANFKMALDELRNISESSDDQDPPRLNRLQELCFIGLMSYFEAFCKDHFASLVNIEPNLIQNLKRGGQNVELDATRVLLYGEQLTTKMGFILAEKYDFGTAQKINALFGALLKLTPFGKAEAAKYAELLSDRNLLVHHGGTFTLSYLEQAKVTYPELKTNAFFNSQIKAKQDVIGAIDFLTEIAKKLLKSSHDALSKHPVENQVQYLGERATALDLLLWWD
jgi:hypothetical protein